MTNVPSQAKVKKRDKRKKKEAKNIYKKHDLRIKGYPSSERVLFLKEHGYPA
jgi:hypothetical protein